MFWLNYLYYFYKGILIRQQSRVWRTGIIMSVIYCSFQKEYDSHVLIARIDLLWNGFHGSSRSGVFFFFTTGDTRCDKPTEISLFVSPTFSHSWEEFERTNSSLQFTLLYGWVLFNLNRQHFWTVKQTSFHNNKPFWCSGTILLHALLYKPKCKWSRFG